VDLYVGGQEHAVLHLLYARFWHKVLFDLGVVKQSEPFPKLVHQGMILGSDGEKMSKSRGNVVNPDSVVQEHGADALRLYEMFMGPLEAMKPWQTSQVQGVVRFRDRVFNIVLAALSDTNSNAAVKAKLSVEEESKLRRLMHRTIKKVTEDIEMMSFNTAISTMMIYSNEVSRLQKNYSIPIEYLSSLVLLLSPFAPHVCEEAWELLGNKESLSRHPWPEFDEALCTVDSFKIAIQVNGKTRGVIEVDAGAGEAEIEGLAMMRVQNVVGNAKVKKTIFVKNKLINIVLEK
jgi:leucyl-tRNA synthetase